MVTVTMVSYDPIKLRDFLGDLRRFTMIEDSI